MVILLLLLLLFLRSKAERSEKERGGKWNKIKVEAGQVGKTQQKEFRPGQSRVEYRRDRIGRNQSARYRSLKLYITRYHDREIEIESNPHFTKFSPLAAGTNQNFKPRSRSRKAKITLPHHTIPHHTYPSSKRKEKKRKEKEEKEETKIRNFTKPYILSLRPLSSSQDIS